MGGLILFVIAKKFKSRLFPSQDQLRNQQISESVENEIDVLKKAQTQSFNNSQYGVFANSIFDGMRYCAGDDYGRVQDILKSMNNDIDVALLIQAYGFRQRSCFGINVGGVDDLFTSVRNELGNEWGGITGYRVKDINKNWEQKGIKYRIWKNKPK